MINNTIKNPWWYKYLHNAGCRITTPRKIVITILRETEEHLSAEDIYLAAIKINPSIGLTTVYRTLCLLEQIGLLQKFEVGEGRARYELIKNPQKKEHHHHLVCMKCKTIIDYTDFMNEEIRLMKKTEEKLSRKHHFTIMHHTIHFYGLCEKCLELIQNNTRK